MRATGDFIARHRNLLLLMLLLATMTVSSLANQERLAQETAAVTLPVAETVGTAADPVEAFRLRRDETVLRDMAALQALAGEEQLDEATRRSAAEQLQALTDARERQMALEGALLASGVSPCAAVISGESVTIVTEKATLTDDETALLMTLAQTYAGASPGNVRVMTADEKAR